MSGQSGKETHFLLCSILKFSQKNLIKSLGGTRKITLFNPIYHFPHFHFLPLTPNLQPLPYTCYLFNIEANNIWTKFYLISLYQISFPPNNPFHFLLSLYKSTSQMSTWCF